ncbi:exopolysaccharide biosynthesis polyprenyl glycosylphosphotransferase [Facilibium subflavum]|uniref:exopolysaccharide biosynthesis polyprenyl glycosylphosphotransferase n=1 Tax=Facilibium subflavum TaxID=2219058 RepID=UPI001AAD1291|nr:exopolysaccharide biosynthesis polyprenyl glycosylphosphotransferase [Facilibium subflavum]
MHFWSLSEESQVFLIVIFIFSWLFRYQRSVMLLEYYTHVIVVTVLFLFIVTAVTVVMRKASHVFLVGSCAIISWFFIVNIARFCIIRAFGHPYRVLIHPDLLNKACMSHKVKLVSKPKVTPQDLKRVHAIVVDRKYAYQDDWDLLIFHASQHDIPVLTIGTYEELIEQRLSLAQLNENWMYAGFSIPLWYRLLKNTLEFILALLLLPLLGLVFAIVACIILITMGRPVFYTQYRIGINGKEFKIYKFRSMIKDSEKNGAQLAKTKDTRITKFGAFMRKFRIDELPQFINILKGDMSLIGPRPEQKVFVEKFSKEIPLYRLRHLVRPGLTGWAQVTQGYTSDQDQTKLKLQYDLYYVKHYSLILDLKIVFKTIYTILTGFGAK